MLGLQRLWLVIGLVSLLGCNAEMTTRGLNATQRRTQGHSLSVIHTIMLFTDYGSHIDWHLISGESGAAFRRPYIY